MRLVKTLSFATNNIKLSLFQTAFISPNKYYLVFKSVANTTVATSKSSY